MKCKEVRFLYAGKGVYIAQSNEI